MFVEECRRLQETAKGSTLEVVLSSIETAGAISSRVAALTREYLTRAEDKE
jgi:hypothetical protein